MIYAVNGVVLYPHLPEGAEVNYEKSWSELFLLIIEYLQSAHKCNE
jgi:hypothetical protein